MPASSFLQCQTWAKPMRNLSWPLFFLNLLLMAAAIDSVVSFMTDILPKENLLRVTLTNFSNN